MIQTLNILKPILADIFAEEEDNITPALSFEDLMADEMDMTEIFMAVEEEFDVSVTSEASEAILTVSDLIAYIEEHRND